MGSFREIKRNARKVVHETMRHPVLFYPDFENTTQYVESYARVHRDWGATGSTKGYASASMEVFEETPEILFSKTDITNDGITLSTKGIVSVLENEVYRIADIVPSDDDFVKVKCYRVPLDDALLYEAPSHI